MRDIDDFIEATRGLDIRLGESQEQRAVRIAVTRALTAQAWRTACIYEASRRMCHEMGVGYACAYDSARPADLADELLR